MASSEQQVLNELERLKEVADAMSDLPLDAQFRILSWACSRFLGVNIGIWRHQILSREGTNHE